MVLSFSNVVIDHLNSNPDDNRAENLVLSCQPCNIKKIKSDRLQTVAKAKLQENEKNSAKSSLNEDKSTLHVSAEIQIGENNIAITEQYLTEIIETDGSIEYADALSSCAYLCHKQTGHGSIQAIRNYLNMFVSSVGPFKIIKNENKKKIIVKREN